MVQVLGAHRVRVQVDAAEVDDPDELRGVAQHDLVGGPPGGKAQLDRLDPVGPRLRRALLEEEVAVGAVHEALERHRTAAGAAQRAVGHGQVVVDQVELGVAALGEEDLVGVGDRDLAAGDGQRLALPGHGVTVAGAAASRRLAPLSDTAHRPLARLRSEGWPTGS